jgi:hypothetical protein
MLTSAMPDTPETAPDRYIALATRNCSSFEVRDTRTDNSVVGYTATTEHIANVVARQMSSAYRRATSAGLSFSADLGRLVDRPREPRVFPLLGLMGQPLEPGGQP